ncbi:MAG: radical SAM protein [Acidaminococcaceae bacterium]|nr:radical SAM protein [Acidaminococcaceae bacterium]
MYYLQRNVELVPGAKNYCLYDLNTQRLYHLDEEATSTLRQLLDEQSSSLAAKSEAGKYLLANAIVVDEKKLLPAIPAPNNTFAPSFAWIEITQNCNLLCRHCYEESSRTKKQPEMSETDYRKAIDFLQQIGVTRIQLVGGEPLMHSQFELLLNYARGKFELIEVYTNGTLLNDRLLNLLKEAGASLALSVYSEKPQQHDYVTRTPGSFNLTFRHIKQALALDIPVRTASVEMKSIDSYTASSLEVTHRSDLPRLTGRANLSLYSKDMLMRKFITKDFFTKPISSDEFFRNRQIHNCFGERIYIDYKLNVFPCAMERRICYGNLATDSSDIIMENELPFMTKDKVKGCAVCEFRYACFDCRCDSNGAAIDEKPWYCTYDPITGTWADLETLADALLHE